ncbi:MAG: signal recognition particle protein [Chloroflexi bacterium]|nr:signal recognition particle protein [Chloroflexota bacterium]
MFESLQERLGEIFRKLRGRGKLTEDDVNAVLREVRMALLEADVNLNVVREFTKKVKEKAVGEAVWKSLTPGQLVIKYVRDELVNLMGGDEPRLEMSQDPPTVIMMVGLHGSGKTTSSAKLARYLKSKGRHPMLVAADLHRPAAITQLQVLGKQIDVPVFAMGAQEKPLSVARAGLKAAISQGNDVVIMDTAGRLHIDQELMDELKEVRDYVKPHEVLLVVDAMTGQDAVNIAEQFNTQIGVDGIVLSKLDGDARGGAALSVRFVTGKPIKFIGVGEKTDALEIFHPDRLVSRILGMGDVLGLIEKAEVELDKEKMEEMQKKLLTQTFTLEDFLDQLQQIKKMGPIENLLGMIPGFSGMPKQAKEFVADERELTKIEAIIQSMTPSERRNPAIINAGRKRRIARGSGTVPADVNRLLKQYDASKKMMKQLTGGKGKKRMPFNLPFPL